VGSTFGVLLVGARGEVGGKVEPSVPADTHLDDASSGLRKAAHVSPTTTCRPVRRNPVMSGMAALARLFL
jgi:hypothetical protein